MAWAVVGLDDLTQASIACSETGGGVGSGVVMKNPRKTRGGRRPDTQNALGLLRMSKHSCAKQWAACWIICQCSEGSMQVQTASSLAGDTASWLIHPNSRKTAAFLFLPCMNTSRSSLAAGGATSLPLALQRLFHLRGWRARGIEIPGRQAGGQCHALQNS